MVSKENQVAAIGYDGPAMVVDKKIKKHYGRYSVRELVEAGLYRSAAALALYNGNEEEMDSVVSAYNRVAGSEYSKEQLGRIFGICVPEGVNKTIEL